MKHIFSKMMFAVVAMAVLLLSNPVNAGVPQGHIKSIDDELKVKIEKSLGDDGYICKMPDDLQLERNISAFLWDNRRLLKKMDVPEHKQVDLIICIMIKRGNHMFDQYTGSSMFEQWCDENVDITRE